MFCGPLSDIRQRSQAQPAGSCVLSDAPLPHPDHYQIDVYSWGDRYVIAGIHSDPLQRVIRNTGRQVTGRGGVVPAILAIATADAEIRLALVQDVLGSLDPEPLDHR